MMRKSVLIAFFALIYYQGSAQSYKVHSLYIFSFTRYVIWPDGYNQGDFEILVLGDSPILQELNQLAQSKKIGDRTIKVAKIGSVAEIRKCNILFVPVSQSALFNDVLAKTGNQSMLLITEEPGLGARGSDINFITKSDGKLGFEVNQASAAKHNLKISNALLSMAN